MRTEKVIVEDYNKSWMDDFAKIKAKLESILGQTAISVEHVGSTSVVGLSAKPIIDIDVVIDTIADLQEAVKKLEINGYIYEGDLGIADRYAFKYEGKHHLNLHHLYVCPQNSEELHRHITFRNFLRNHPEAVAEYSRIKKKGAKLYPNNIEKYIEFKSACIAELYKKCGLL